MKNNRLYFFFIILSFVCNNLNGQEIRGRSQVGAINITRSEKDLFKTTSLEEYNLSEIGSYYAVIIAVNEYLDDRIMDLDEPLSDASNLYLTLTEKYTFNEQNITFLKNSTRADIIIVLDDLSNKLKGNDNLLIFFAGHGYWDSKKQLGYWLPADATQSNTVNWISNSTIQEYIGSIKTKHTLLIADACFAGSIFKTRTVFNDAPKSIEKLYSMSSRKAITSGTLEMVPDKSVFLEYLLNRLRSNKEKYITSETLFTSFREAVINNSIVVPQFGIIFNTGDEGGDFVFILK
jgi:hypothetical protein